MFLFSLLCFIFVSVASWIISSYIIIEKYPQYSINYEIEYRTYKNIGRSNLRKKDAKYKIKRFDKYSQWKNCISKKYVNEKYVISNNSRKDLFHFLNQKLRNKKLEKNIYEVLLIPLIMLFVTVSFGFIDLPEKESYITLFIAIILVEVCSLTEIIKVSSNLEFIEDYIEIIVDLNDKKTNNEGIY